MVVFDFTENPRKITDEGNAMSFNQIIIIASITQRSLGG
jgi:hypothetical protein